MSKLVHFLSVSETSRALSKDVKKVRFFFKSIRQCMAEDLLQSHSGVMIGGPGHIVEADESKFGKRKFHQGKRVVGKWVLGGYDRQTGQIFLVECPDNVRNHHTLVGLIKKHVRPGTTILTDCWKGYNKLADHGYTHLTVNHSQGFINPATGVHTNTCEGMWFHAKTHMKRGHGHVRQDSEALEVALYEFMWMKKFGLKARDDQSNRRMFMQEIPRLMDRIFG